jgi:hypothetical protein
MANEMVTEFHTPAAPGLSQIERVVDIFIAPSKTFTDILRSSSMWLPFLLMVIFSAASAYTIDKQVGYDRIYQTSVSKMPQFVQDAMAKQPPEVRAKAARSGEANTRMSSYGLPVILLIVFSLYSLIIWASFNFGLGAKTTWKQVFAVSWYAALPYIFRSVLTILTVMFGGNSESLDLKNPVGTNLAYYMPDAAGWLKGFLSAFDLIALWSFVLMVIGMSIVAKKSITQSAVIVGIFFLIGVLVATAGGAFSG